MANILNKAKEFFAGSVEKVGANLLGSIGGIIDKFNLSPEQKQQFLAEATKEVNRHLEAKMQDDTKRLEMEFKDVDSARNMQIQALGQTDLFSKRFVYYLALLVVIIVALYDFCLFKVDYPEKNRDLINMVAGILNSSALVMILGFFFGSSKGSKDAGERLDRLMDKQ